MSQTTVDAAGVSIGEQTAMATIDRLEKLNGALESIGESSVDQLNDETLVELRQGFKELEDLSKEVRKSLLDGELKNRVEPGDSLHGLNHIQSHRKVLAEDPKSVIGRAVNQRLDYTRFIEVKASDLAEVYPDLAEIRQQEYTYFR